MDELTATHIIDGREYTVYGCWDEKTKENGFDYFDVFDDKGNCITLGNMFYKVPTIKDIKTIR